MSKVLLKISVRSFLDRKLDITSIRKTVREQSLESQFFKKVETSGIYTIQFGFYLWKT